MKTLRIFGIGLAAFFALPLLPIIGFMHLLAFADETENRRKSAPRVA